MLRPRSKPSKMICRIDASAFASVMFALVAAVMGPFMSWPDLPRHQADLPRVSHAETLRRANREDAMFITIPRDGWIWFGSDRVGPNDLPGLIQKQLRGGAERRVYVRADARAKYGAVVQVLDAIEAAGVQDVAFLVEPRPAAQARQP